MPLYEYRCLQCGHGFEKIQSFAAEPEKLCPKCGGELVRPLTAPALQFKGAGWYVNDYAPKAAASGGAKDGAAETAKNQGGEGSGAAGGEAGSGATGDSKTGDSKTAGGAAGTGGSGTGTSAATPAAPAAAKAGPSATGGA